MKQLDFDTIKNSVINKGYKWFNDRPNIVGIRTNNNLPNVFNDYIVVCDERTKLFKGWMSTTEPGVYWLQNPMNVKGAGIMVPGQYLDCWMIGPHGSGLNRHEALVQVKNITLYRDNNKDIKIDINPNDLHSGVFGVNIHSTGRLNWIAKTIDKWSAGCQVFPNYNSFLEFMKIVKNSKQRTYSYTLLTENDIL